jgi:single-strand DNA-binding protein
MASSLNKVTLIGNVGKDPEIRSTSDGREIASFSVATSESWKDKASGERRERTEWHKIVVFSEALVNLVKNYVKRGTKLYLEGSLQTRKWVDNTGQEKYTTEIILQNYSANITLLDSRSGNESGDNFALPGNASSSNIKEFAHSELDDEIPF